MKIKRRLFSGIALAAMVFGLAGGIPAFRADALTIEEYRQAVLGGRVYPLQVPVNRPDVAVTPQGSSASQASPQPQSLSSGPDNRQFADYYNAVLNSTRKPVYYTNQASPPAQSPGTGSSIPPVNPGSGGDVQLPAPAAELTAAETRLFELINSARLNEGVRPVEIDQKLVEIARLKARDMIENGYFGHISPTYGTPGQMLRKFGVNFRSAGENLAKAGDVYKAHLLFLASTQGHREIMLNPNYNKVGVAVVAQGSSVLVVELFAEL